MSSSYESINHGTLSGVTTTNLGAAQDRQVRFTYLKPGTEGVISINPLVTGTETPAVEGEVIVWWNTSLDIAQLFVGRDGQWVRMFGGANIQSRSLPSGDERRINQYRRMFDSMDV